MEHRRLGTSGLFVSEVIFGNWLTHGETVDEAAATACVRAALDAGIDTFDTADVYAQGAAETLLGRALRGLPRESVTIASKVCLPVGDGANDRGLSRKHIIQSCHDSLRRLGTDHLDLYQAHRFDPGTPLDETFEAFDTLIGQGKIGYVGVSEWTAEQLRQGIAASAGLRARIVANQPQYNMLWRVIESEVVPVCAAAGIGQVVFQPLAQGVLTGKYRPGEPVPPGSRAAAGGRAPRFINRVLGDRLLERVQALRPVAAEAGLSMAQLAVAWTLHRPTVTAAIIGASRPEQVTENAAASGVPLGDDLLKRIDEALDELVDRDPAKTARMMAVRPGWSATPPD
ncbi:aldo/keto reductase [Actinoplanes sp. SE50]|uniref:aldo/keto reductase family protein n=1 Tax=unclassified Actinoplanes TaxID=2626549 RepID=UPI00023ECAF7|nr:MULTISPECIES: aldo/keto reductase family protein [unclassified Actinoplanes]AEV83743.1 Aldo-keto reductase-like family 1 member C1 protein [Actinoplanes sp. SE50/110]ATO82113.1 aldo/keto reductase [Actinoplanes sp. SE50]SLL99520.1 aldo/keto reductase [Actinoplanes sp. SE50/110]